MIPSLVYTSLDFGLFRVVRPHGRYLVNPARWLDAYYRMKCEISAEDASWKILTESNSKWPPIIYFHMPNNILQTVLDASPLL